MQDGQCWVRFLPFVSLCSLLVLYDDESWLEGFVCTPPDAVSTREMFS